MAVLAQEKDDFNLIDVMDQIREKMIRRHPHVFGQTSVNSPEEVSHIWEKIKDEDKDLSKTKSSFLQDVPISLPALLRAHRLSSKASKVGFDWKTKDGIQEKVKEELNELQEALSGQNPDQVGEEIGDLLFSLVNLARHWGLNAESLLRNANQKFINRFQDMERELQSIGKDLANATPDEMNEVWDKIKGKG